MTERATLARPYARAAFELAEAEGSLPRWSEMLELAAAVVADAQVASLIGDPRVAPADLAELIVAAAGDGIDGAGANLVRVLAESRRLGLLTEIAALYGHYRAEAERVIDVEVRSAVALDDAQQASLIAALKTRLGRDVRLHTELDPDLIGGAVIRAGDLVIDGSVRDRLHKLAAAVAH